MLGPYPHVPPPATDLVQYQQPASDHYPGCEGSFLEHRPCPLVPGDCVSLGLRALGPCSACACLVQSFSESQVCLKLSASDFSPVSHTSFVMSFGESLTTPFESNLASVYLGQDGQGMEKELSTLFFFASRDLFISLRFRL